MERKKKKVNQGINMMDFWSAVIEKEKKNHKNGNNGFTLAELVIVMAIIAILAAAIAPAIIRYIDKSRKAIDIETAQAIFEAANLASASYDDDIAEGWTMTAKASNVGRTEVTKAGHNKSLEKDYKAKKDTYSISVVAWGRGLNYNGPPRTGVEWQNAKFKSTLDDQPGGAKQRAYTNEFLKNLLHGSAVDAVYYPKEGRSSQGFDGYSDETMLFRFLKDAGYGYAEVWLLCINDKSLTPEVWIGDKNMNGKGGGSVRPLYRLYPDPCDEYRN